MSKEKSDPKVIGERISQIRMALGLTMEEFAKSIDETTTKGTVSNWEHGRNLPNKARLARIAELGGYSLNGLLQTHKPDINKAVEKVRNMPKRDYDQELQNLLTENWLKKLGKQDKASLILFLEYLKEYSEKLYPKVSSTMFGFLFDISQRDKAELNTAYNVAQMYQAYKDAQEFIDTLFLSEPKTKEPFDQPFSSYD